MPVTPNVSGPNPGDITLAGPRHGVAASEATAGSTPPPPPPAAADGLQHAPDLAPISPPLWRQLARHQLLLPLLRQHVVASAVATTALSDTERTQAQAGWAAQLGLRSPEALQAHLLNNGLSEADAVWQAELPLRLAHHCARHFSHRAEQRFLARKNQLDQVIYSLLRVEDGALARELYLRIAEGEADFAELAATYAKGPEQATRGVIGPVPLMQAHPTLAELLRTSRPGQLHAPLAIEQWWLVVRLETIRPANFDAEMQQRMARELFEDWVEAEVGRLLAAGPEATGLSSGASA